MHQIGRVAARDSVRDGKRSSYTSFGLSRLVPSSAPWDTSAGLNLHVSGFNLYVFASLISM